ncbi:hypothetical protein ACET60_06410 [Aeromonas veronii]
MSDASFLMEAVKKINGMKASNGTLFCSENGGRQEIFNDEIAILNQWFDCLSLGCSTLFCVFLKGNIPFAGSIAGTRLRQIGDISNIQRHQKEHEHEC